MALQFFVFCCLCNSISHGLCCVVQTSVSFWCQSIGRLCETNVKFLLRAESWRWLVVAHSAAKFRYWQATHHCCPSYHKQIVACSVPLCEGAEPASTQTSTVVAARSAARARWPHASRPGSGRRRDLVYFAVWGSRKRVDAPSVVPFDQVALQPFRFLSLYRPTTNAGTEQSFWTTKQWFIFVASQLASTTHSI